jgi:hypothetical protein
MSKYQLEYFNHYDLSKATSSRLITLAGIIPPHGYFMVNDSSMLLCFRVTIDSVSLGLSSTAGIVAIVSNTQAKAGGAITPVLEDYVGWSKTVAGGAQTLPSNTNAFLQRLPLDAGNNPSVATPGEGSWQTVQPASNDPCGLVTPTSKPVASGLNELLPATEPPAQIVSLADTGSDAGPAPALPAADVGLMAPEITELLANPDGTGNDDSDEFIELYNPNVSSFDLGGFVLQTGLTRTHKYTFPSGTKLTGKSFTTFYSDETGLSLSNTTGQAKLIDPLSKTVASSGIYKNAKDGIAWALAKGKWYWTTSLTPNKPNIIKSPVSKSKSKKSTTSVNKLGTHKASAASSGSQSSTTTSGQGSDQQPSSTPVHASALVVIAGLALLYGAYEYRADIANRIYQFKRYLRGRGGDRTLLKGR